MIDTEVSPLARATNSELQEPQLLIDRFGLPLWTARLTGPVTGALMFRVGSGDEPLTQRGLTHLVEHLALSGFHDPALQWNGFVDLNRTVFHATGPQPNVEQFLMLVARQLGRADPDLVRRERSVLAAEARGAALSTVGNLLARRYGTQQWGSTAWGEIAMRDVRVEAIEEWQQRWFTRENAVVWMTAAPTPSFQIDLRSGTRRLPFDPPELLSGRGWVRHDARCVAMLARAERSSATAAATGAIVSELHRTLRDRGLGYSVQGFWHRLTATRGALAVVTDLVDKRELEHVSVVLDVIDQLCGHMPDRVLEERRVAFEQASADDCTRAQLDAWSLNLLLGLERTTAAAERAEEAGVTSDQISKVCVALRDDMLLALPPTVAPPASRLEKLVVTRDVAVTGRPYKRRVLNVREDAKVTLTVGDSGISWEAPTSVTTVQWDQVAALLKWRDGTRMAIDRRGSSVLVEPTKYQGGRAATAAIDQHIDARKAVDAGSRYATLVVTAGPPKALKHLTQLRKLIAGGLVLLTLLGILDALFGPRPINAVGLVVAALSLAAFFVFAVATTRRPSPFMWDNGNTRTGVPDELDRSTWYVPGGLLFGWAIQHGHLDASWAAAHQTELAEFADGRMTAPVLYRAVTGVLADDMLGEDTNEFFTDYLAQPKAGYNHDLRAVYPKGSFFSIPDTSASQKVVSRFVEKAFVDWQRTSRIRRHIRRLVGPWDGPQSTYWAAGLVQKARHRRWN